MKEPRTIEEQYTSAGNADDLTVTSERRSDADVLIAAGWAPGLLGGVLMRLHSEWDGAAKKRRMDETEAFLLFGQLKSLQRVLGIITAYLTARGDKIPLVGAKAVVMYWLDARCQSCGGRGAHVMPGAPILGRPCRPCGGSGIRATPLGELGNLALNMMDSSVEQARRSMRLRLQNR